MRDEHPRADQTPQPQRGSERLRLSAHSENSAGRAAALPPSGPLLACLERDSRASWAQAILSGDGAFGTLALAVFIATTVNTIVETGLAITTVRIRRGPWRAFLHSASVIALVAVSLDASLMTMLVFAYEQVTSWAILLFFGPALAAHSLYRMYRRNVPRRMSLGRRMRCLSANVSFASALVAALDARDAYTAGHLSSVARYAQLAARELNLSAEEQELARLCGLVHDIGKVGPYQLGFSKNQDPSRGTSGP